MSETIKECICICCDEVIEENEAYGNVTDKGDPICDSCHSDDTSDPVATIEIHHSKGDRLYDNFDLIRIGDYIKVSTDDQYQDDFWIEDHYSGYRGYTDVKSDKWTEIGFVNVRAFDEYQERVLSKPVNEFGDILLDNSIIYASSSAKTSNCMVANLSYWVKNEDLKKAKRIKRRLMKQYNLDEDDF